MQYEPEIEHTNSIITMMYNYRIVIRNQFIANDIWIGRLSDLGLCGLLSRNVHLDEGCMDGTQVKRNQHWIFWNLNATEATTDHECEVLAVNAKE